MSGVAPCPFCGEQGQLIRSPIFQREWRASCRGCFATGAPRPTAEEAATVWGSRQNTEAVLHEPLLSVLAALVAAVSILMRAEDKGVRPSKAVASNAMFVQMLKDYDAATISARSALLKLEG